MFSQAPKLDSDNLLLRPMTPNDFEGLFACAGDKNVWAGHPSPNRYKKDQFKTWFSDAIDNGNALTIVRKKTGEIIGSTRFYFEESNSDSVSIGYTFIAHKYWGGDVNSELKATMLNYAFKHFSSVWFHVSPINVRSQKAVLKLGAKFIGSKHASLLGGEPIDWYFYKIEKKDWQSKS